MDSYTIIKGVHQSEKAGDMQDLYNSLNRRTKGMTENVLAKYTLRVDIRANKHQIRRAVEELFKGVKVASVNTSRVRGKTKRARTLQAGRTSDWKKAVVTLKEGEIQLV